MSDVSKLRNLLRVKPGAKFSLADHDPDATHGFNKSLGCQRNSRA